MAEHRNKKKRIAHIGNMASVQTAKLQSDDGLAQADSNLVYDIMQSMNKSQNVLSYKQLQEVRSKENFISRTDNSEQNSSSKQNGKPVIPKQIKKFVPEKTFPLMAKCQKSMKYLKKNRCIPKPRAHVGFIPRPLQKPTSTFKPNDIYTNCSVSNNTENLNESSMKIKQNSKKNRLSPEMNVKLKKPKISKFLRKSCDKNDFQTKYSEKDPALISNSDTDSDEFEQFLQKHHPEKFTASNNYSTDSSAVHRIKRGNKIKKKKRKQFICVTKIGKISRKTLSDSEGTAECNENYCNRVSDKDDFTGNSCNRQFHSKRYGRITQYENSDDSASDTHINDSGIFNYDSFNSSEDENILLTKSLNNKKGNHAIDLDDSEMFDTLAAEPSFVPSSSTSISEFKDTMCYDMLKLKCKIPCYVRIERDPLLDQKVDSLRANISPITNMVPISTFGDDDDCIIISESTTNFTSQNSENLRQSIESRNSCQRESAGISEVLTDINDMHNEKLIFNSNVLRPQTEMNSLLSDKKSDDIVCIVEDMTLDEVDNEKEASRSATASSKSLSDTINGPEKEACFISKTTRETHENVSSPQYKEKIAPLVNCIPQHSSELPNNETDVSFNCDGTTSTTEGETFNVHILSVESLNESDIIVLSDDSEGKDTEIVPTVNETGETAAEDSDVEIICLDSNINEEKSVNQNVGDDLNRGTPNKVISALNENLNSSTIQPIILNEEDCIILDSVGIPSENTCTAKIVDKVQQSSETNAVNVISNEKKNTNKNEEPVITSDNLRDSDKNSILETLSTIDFNCINQVINETTITNTQKEKNTDSVSCRAENPLCEKVQTSYRTADSFPAKLQQSQNNTCAQKQVSVDTSVTSICSSEVNKIRRLKTSPVDTFEECDKLLKNSNVLPKIIKNVSENVPSPVKSNSIHSSTILSAPKLLVSKKEIIPSSLKTELNALFHSQKNRQLLSGCSKKESSESTFDELDIIAAKSIQNLDEKHIQTILPLVELYKSEYQKLIEIRCTEENVTAGLKLLEESQARKLRNISMSLKNIGKDDNCFSKVINELEGEKNERGSFMKRNPVKSDESLDEIKKPLENVTQPSNSNRPDIDKDDKIKIFHPSIVARASEILRSESVGPSSSQEVYNHLINSMCAECGKHAMAACSGCAKIYYCSEKCGISYWSKGHYATCRR